MPKVSSKATKGTKENIDVTAVKAVDAVKGPGTAQKSKGQRSLYRKYLNDNIPQWRDQNPTASYRDAVSAVSSMWGVADENPRKGEAVDVKKKPAKK